MFQYIPYRPEFKDEILQSKLISERVFNKHLSKGFPWFWLKLFRLYWTDLYVYQNTENDEIIGVASLRIRLDFKKLRYNPWFYGLYIKESYRGRGLGEKLMQAQIALTDKRPAYSVVNPKNKKAIELHYKQGFRLAKDKGNVLIMELPA